MSIHGNHVIHETPRPEREQLVAMLEPIELDRGTVLWEPGDEVLSLVFPQTCVVSLIRAFATGDNIETAIVGCEGVVCPTAVLGAQRASSRHLVQIAGQAQRMRKSDFARALDELPGFRLAVHRFAASFMDLALLQVACNRLHAVEQRLARWLLMMRDRSQADTMPLTHEMIAEMLGVYRPTVSHALRELRDAGLIESRPGQITILAHGGLEAIACECYRLAARMVPAAC